MIQANLCQIENGYQCRCCISSYEAFQATVVRDTFVFDAKADINSFQVYVALPSHDWWRQQ